MDGIFGCHEVNLYLMKKLNQLGRMMGWIFTGNKYTLKTLKEFSVIAELKLYIFTYIDNTIGQCKKKL